MMPGSCACNKLAVLEGLGAGNGQPEVPPDSGLTEWSQLASKTADALSKEGDKKKADILDAALSITTEAIAIPGVGWAIALGGAVVNGILRVLGIRGTTQHVDHTTADQKASQWVNTNVLPVFDKIPPDAKLKMVDLIYQFWNNEDARLGTYWNSYTRNHGGLPVPVADVQALLARNDVNEMRGDIAYAVAYWFRTILGKVDAAHAQEEMTNDFFSYFGSDVLEPLDQYMLAKYNATVAQYNAAGGTLLSPVTGSALPWILGIGLLLAIPAMSVMKRGRKRGRKVA